MSLEMGPETLKAYTGRLKEEGPALEAPSFGDLFEANRLMTFVSTQEGADKKLTDSMLAEIEKYKKITGKEALNFGFNEQGFPTNEAAHKQYKAMTQEIEELNKGGANLKTYEEILSQGQKEQGQVILNAARLNERADEKNVVTSFATQMLGGMVGYAQTPTGALVSALPAPILGSGVKLASRAGLKNIATVGGIEGVINAGIAVEQTRVQGEALGDPASNQELLEAGALGFGFGFVFGGAVGAGTQAIRNRFHAVQGLKTDREARDAYQAQADRVAQAKAEKGAIDPDIEAVGEASQEMAFLYDSKPSNVDIEDHVRNLVETEQRALKDTYDEVEIPDSVREMKSEEVLTLDSDHLAEIDDARNLIQNERAFLDPETQETIDLLGDFQVIDRQAKEMDLVATCMTGGSNES